MALSVVQHIKPAGYRRTWAEISLEAIAWNTGLFKAALSPRTALMAVVKANGYGHGAVETARAALDAGADRLGVAIVDEALRLREAGCGQPVLVLGYTPPSSVRAAVQNDIGLTAFTDDVLDEIIRCADELSKPARIHLKIDTGMNRIGTGDAKDTLRLARKATAARHVVLEGIFTHFADADGDDPAYTEQQFDTFGQAVSMLEQHGIDVPLKHCCNSAAAMRYPPMHLDMVRVGIALYGLHPSGQTRLPAYPLRPAMRLVSEISALRHTPAGQTVGYGRTFAAAADSTIATIPIGYADGLSRRLSNKAYALVRGVRVPYAGNVCMDQTMLDVTRVPDAQVGDVAVLFGQSGQDRIPVEELAALLGTINYEIVCAVGSRVPRVYLPRSREEAATGS